MTCAEADAHTFRKDCKHCIKERNHIVVLIKKLGTATHKTRFRVALKTSL
jgi:hypothetical protein